jgi:hypothetical protein
MGIGGQEAPGAGRMQYRRSEPSPGRIRRAVLGVGRPTLAPSTTPVVLTTSMDEDEITRRLGVAPGPTMKALVALAEQVSPDHPSEAFDSLWLGMSWLERGQGGGQGTPRNVHPFAETGGDLNHFGFLMDQHQPTEDRPIVYVVPKDDAEATKIVAPNLREFLGLVAIAFGEVVSRDATDEQWLGFRNEWYGDDPERLAEMARLSDLLCTIPGVTRPSRPSSVANAYPNQPFTLDLDEGAVSPGAVDTKRTDQQFAPTIESLSRVVVKGAGLGGLVAAGLYYWKGVPLVWAVTGLPIGAASFVLPRLRGYDTLHVGDEAITCRHGTREWRIEYGNISRVYKFQEQWIFESKPPHRRYTFHLRGHERHLKDLAVTIETRAASLRLGWLESIARISRLLR